MQADVAEMNVRRRPVGGRPLAIGIGLNTQLCCVGSFGSAQRFDYSAIGNDVNFASCFEGLTKYDRAKADGRRMSRSLGGCLSSGGRFLKGPQDPLRLCVTENDGLTKRTVVFRASQRARPGSNAAPWPCRRRAPTRPAGHYSLPRRAGVKQGPDAQALNKDPTRRRQTKT